MSSSEELRLIVEFREQLTFGETLEYFIDVSKEYSARF